MLTVASLRKDHTYMIFRMRHQNQNEIALTLQEDLSLAFMPA